eukprot:SAG31_NODE_18890_length_619_cov_0.934615_2_plen_128_part_00
MVLGFICDMYCAEMGQGIHVKMAQIVAGVLGCPLESVRVGENATEVVPNTNKTAAAAGTDVNGKAVEAAAMELATRLDPIRKCLHMELARSPTFAEIAAAADKNSINLSAGGFRKGGKQCIYAFSLN